MKKVLLLQGGWEGHQPKEVAELFAGEMQQQGFETQTESSLDILADVEKLKEFSLIFPCWTMGEISNEQQQGLDAAVRSGIGFGGVHGGMGDAFRGCLDYEWMTGGHFVGHPHVGDYQVDVLDLEHPIMTGMPKSFSYNSEQYYMMIDPGIEVLAETDYIYENRTVKMPVVWIKHWGSGRVFYNALGHELREFSDYPAVREMTVRGLLWAAREL
ncbi:MAG: ThuA domain-containing protein [Abditibacteriaceae bacterium]